MNAEQALWIHTKKPISYTTADFTWRRPAYAGPSKHDRTEVTFIQNDTEEAADSFDETKIL